MLNDGNTNKHSRNKKANMSDIQHLKLTLPYCTALESLSTLAIAVRSLHSAVSADLCILGRDVPVVIITQHRSGPDIPDAVYVFSALGGDDEKMRGFSVVAEFSDRPPTCVETVGFGGALSLIRDLIDRRSSASIDSGTRIRLQVFCQMHGARVDTIDTRDAIAKNRAFRNADPAALVIQHESVVTLSDGSVFVLEQLGDDYDTPTTLWVIRHLISYDENWTPGEDDVLESFDDMCYHLLQLGGSALMRSQIDESSPPIR